MSLVSLLTGKPEVEVEDLCLYYYMRNVFHDPAASSESGYDLYLKAILQGLARYDESFAATDMDVFKRELEAIKMEVFSLALTHRTQEHSLLLRQMAYTKELFTNPFYSEIVSDGLWEAMYAYNTAIGSVAETSAPGNERVRRARVVMVNTWKCELLTQWLSKGIDAECAFRVLNRLFAEKKWTEEAWPELMTPRFLAAQYARRLGSDGRVNCKALDYLACSVWIEYRDASSTIKEFRLQ